MSEPNTWVCQNCGNEELFDGNDGFFYCTGCNSQADDLLDTGVADEDFYDKEGNAHGGLYSTRNCRNHRSAAVNPQPLNYASPEHQNAADAEGPMGPNNVRWTDEDYYTQIRLRYVLGVQRMIQLQCEALVREFKVNPLICGLSGTIWLRFLAWTRVFDDQWADDAFIKSEIQQEGELLEDFKPRTEYRVEPHTKYGQRAVMVWFRSLRSTIPLSCTLAISFLACHLSREAILPTDIVKWSLEGQLPYFSAFLQIEKDLGRSSLQISSRLMFRPSESVPVQKLESLAASIAESIGLHLPPVNFYAIASRYLDRLSLPVEKIFPHMCRIYEWSMPPELWLPKNEFRLPTRVYVMSILIVAVRILYDIHGFGEWEKSLSSRHSLSSTSNQMGDLDPTFSSKMRSGAEKDTGSPSHILENSGTKLVRNSELDVAELLSGLEARYDDISDTYEYCKNLPTYLQFCKDEVFSGCKDPKEDEQIELLWDFYQNGKDSETAVEQQGLPCRTSDKEEAIRRMKLDMEEKRFYYIPPRENLKRLDYLHYERKKDEGAYTYVAHADYYVLLRACARVAEVEIRCLHIGVLSLENRLAWLEKRVDHCLHLSPSVLSCQYCHDMVPQNATYAETGNATDTENDI